MSFGFDYLDILTTNVEGHIDSTESICHNTQMVTHYYIVLKGAEILPG